MKVRITEVVVGGGTVRVRFSTPMGEGSGTWSGDAPSVGDERFVELATAEEPVSGVDLVETVEPVGIRTDGVTSTLVGTVSATADDGFARLEVGDGALDLEVSGVRPREGARYRLTVGDLQIYDTRI